MGSANPLAGALGRAYAYGRSQSGRFLRQMLHLGLNRDEEGRIVFEGMLPNVAGGKMGEFNVRFGQPSSLSSRSVNNLPPFLDLEADGAEGILAEVARRGVAPKVIYTNTSSEYWGGHGALAHVTAEGAADAELPDNVRSWLFCGTQHAPANLPISDTNPDSGARGAQALNYVDYRPLMRAALAHLDNWVTHNEQPPGNGYPRYADSTIIEAGELAEFFHALPYVEFPEHHKIMRRLDFGPDRAAPTVIPRVSANRILPWCRRSTPTGTRWVGSGCRPSLCPWQPTRAGTCGTLTSAAQVRCCLRAGPWSAGRFPLP